jgi:Arc/MetJ family transcription regulator
MHKGGFMRTTLDLPEKLINEAMTLTNIHTKTELIKTALENLIWKEKVKEITKYFGKVNLDISLDKMGIII